MEISIRSLNTRRNHMFFIKVNQIFLKGQHGPTRTVPDPSFSKVEGNRNKARVFDGNF